MSAYEKAYAHLLDHYGSEDAITEHVGKYIKQFGGVMAFDAGVIAKAAEKGWVNDDVPAPVPQLSDEYLKAMINENYDATGKENADVSLTGIVAGIGDTQEAMMFGEPKPVVYVSLEGDGDKRSIRMCDHEGFMSKAGNEIQANPCRTVWEQLKLGGIVGRAVKLAPVRATRKYVDVDTYRYYLESTPFTRVKVYKEQSGE